MSSQSVYEVEYRLTENDYYNYNIIVYNDLIIKKSHSQLLICMSIVLAALIVLGAFFFTNKFQLIFIILEMILILLGIYSVIYYPLIFPYKLKKAAKKEYINNMIDEKYFMLKFSDKGIDERIISDDVSNTSFEWSDFDRIYIYDKYLIFIIHAQKRIIIPSKVLKFKHDAELKSFVIYHAEKNNVIRIYQK